MYGNACIALDGNGAACGGDVAVLQAGGAGGGEINPGAARVQSYTIPEAEVRGRGSAWGRTGGTDPDGSGDTGAGGLGFDQPWSFDLQGAAAAGATVMSPAAPDPDALLLILLLAPSWRELVLKLMLPPLPAPEAEETSWAP